MRCANLCSRVSLISVLAALVTGCANYDYSKMVAVLPLSIVQINIPLEIPSGEARVYIQDGNTFVSRGKVDRFLTYCSVLMNVLHEPGTPLLKVSPGRFEVREVRQSNDRFNNGLVLTASTIWVAESMPSNTFFTTEMRLRSDEQTDVRSLICVKESSLRGSHYASFDEINIALGDAVTIEPYQQ
jgi:hypothetical protein